MPGPKGIKGIDKSDRAFDSIRHIRTSAVVVAVACLARLVLRELGCRSLAETQGLRPKHI